METVQGELKRFRTAIHDIASGNFLRSPKRANEKPGFEWFQKIRHRLGKKIPRELSRRLKALKTTMAAEESAGNMENDFDRKAGEFNGKCEDEQPDIDGVRSQNSNDASETGMCASVLESREQSDAVVVPNGNEMMSVDGMLLNGGGAGAVSAQEDNGTDDVTSINIAADEFAEFRSQQESSPVVVSYGNETASTEGDLMNNGKSDSSLLQAQEEGAEAVTSTDPATGDLSAPGSQEAESAPLVSNGTEIASTDTDLMNGDTSPAPVQEENGSDAVTSATPAVDDVSALRKRKKSLQQLCDVLMEERDQATLSLKEKDDEVLRLRKRAMEHEQEKGDLKNQLAKALGRSVLAEKEMVNAKEENAKLRVEIVSLIKRIDDLEEENSGLKCQLEKARGNQTLDSESVSLTRMDELQEEPASVAGEDKHEIPNVEDSKAEIQDEPESAEIARARDANEEDENADVVRRRERAAQRTAPNFYRHSFAGSLPRPFHSYELPRQGSRDEGPPLHERSWSFQSDTSAESEPESGGNAAPSIPSFMRRADKPTYLKSGFSPVQFNYQPLPESISKRRESWDTMRHSSMLERARARGDSLNKPHESSSDSESSGIGSGASNEPIERLSREQHESEFNSAPDYLDGGLGKHTEEIETEKCGVTLQISSLPPTSAARDAENSENSNDLNSSPTASTYENHANAPLQGAEHVESNDRSQEHAEEDGKRENVSDLVNIWNRRTTEVCDI